MHRVSMEQRRKARVRARFGRSVGHWPDTSVFQTDTCAAPPLSRSGSFFLRHICTMGDFFNASRGAVFRTVSVSGDVTRANNRSAASMNGDSRSSASQRAALITIRIWRSIWLDGRFEALLFQGLLGVFYFRRKLPVRFVLFVMQNLTLGSLRPLS